MKFYKGIIIPETFSELVESILKNHNPKFITEKIAENRKKIITAAENFHQRAGTLTDSLKEEIEQLDASENHFFLLSSHQPNLMPYSGVIRKIVLLEAVKRKIETLTASPVIALHLISNESFPDRWTKTTQLPDITSKKGRLDISNPDIKKKPHYRLTGYGNYAIRISAIPKPSKEILSLWKEKIKNWLDRSLKPGKRLARKTGYEIYNQQLDKLRSNEEEFTQILDEAYERARSYADLNSFMLSKIVNEKWGNRTLFAYYSDTTQVFKEETLSILNDYETYWKALKEAKEQIRGEKLSERLAPFWYHCKCGGMANMLIKDNENNASYQGKCTNCNRTYQFNTSNIISENSDFFNNVSLRAIPYFLIRAKSLALDFYAGGTGGLKAYYPETKIVAEKLEINWPIIGIWNTYDHYAGIGQLFAFLTLKQDSSQKISKRALQVFEGKYSIVDYALNVGLKETNQQWLKYLLNENADLTVDVVLKSVLEGKLTEDFLNFINKRKFDVQTCENNREAKFNEHKIQSSIG